LRSLRPLAVLTLLLLTGFVRDVYAQNPATLTIDDFEGGVGTWTRNDKLKSTGGEATLVDILSTPVTGGDPGSKLGALITFKSGLDEWATVSRQISGADWAKVGAERITFWLQAGGDSPGVNLLLRGTYKKPDGTPYEIVFALPRPVRLDIQRWRKVVIPLTDFRGPGKETLDGRLSGLYALQFSQAGTWNSRFFTVDDIQVEGSGIPEAAPTPVPTPTPAPAAPIATVTPGPTAVSGIAVSADFLRSLGHIRATANLTIGASENGPNAQPLETSLPFRQAIGLLRPSYVRLDAAGFSQLTDSSQPAFDFTRLQSAVDQVRILGAEPLISLTNPSEWGLDTKGFGVFVADVARALNQRGQPPVRYFELDTASDNLDGATALLYYNAGYDALKGLSRNFSVGGCGAEAEDQATQTAFLTGARGLDFLSVAFYGATSGQPSDGDLLQAARDVAPLKAVAHLLDGSRFPRAALYVTAANVSNVRGGDNNAPTDIRLVQTLSAAWWAQYMASGSRLADEVFQNDAVNPEWGLLDSNARAYPAYYSLWLWNTYFPAGSDRVLSTSADPSVFATACNTATAHNLLLVNTTSTDQTVKVAIRGFPVLHEARIRIFDDAQKSVEFDPLPQSPFQTVDLPPYAVAVVQFLEPQKK